MFTIDNNQFENKKEPQENVIQAEALGESQASFAAREAEKIKHRLELKKKQQKKIKSIFGGLLGVILLLLVVLGYSQYKLHTLSNEEKIIPSETMYVNASTTPQEIISRVGRHILLPAGEPQIAEVQDIEKLREQQAFFKNAENGDIIVLYDTMIFIYRPSKDIIIASGDITGAGQLKP